MSDTQAPNKSSVVDRIRGMFTAKKQTAKQTYFALVAASVSRELTKKEDAELFGAMQEIGATDADLTEHQRILRNIAESKAAGESLPRMRAEHDAANAAKAVMEAEYEEFKKRYTVVVSRCEVAASNLSTANMIAGRIDGLMDHWNSISQA